MSRYRLVVLAQDDILVDHGPTQDFVVDTPILIDQVVVVVESPKMLSAVVEEFRSIMRGQAFS